MGHKRLFIHVPKCGGMSIRAHKEALAHRVIVPRARHDWASVDDYDTATTFMAANGEHTGIEHSRWRDLAPHLQAVPAVAFVRNPWSRVASRYFFGRHVVESGKAPPFYMADTFEGFLDERHAYGNVPFMWLRAVRGWYPAFDHISDDSGRVVCDVLRTESLGSDSAAYFGERPKRRHNVTRGSQPYMSIYTDRTIQIVADWYARDIEAFGFDFDTPATRGLWEGLDS